MVAPTQASAYVNTENGIRTIVINVSADPSKNRGEAGYAGAIGNRLAQDSGDATEIHFFRNAGDEAANPDSTAIPRSTDDYEKTAPHINSKYSVEAIQSIRPGDKVVIMGEGMTTLDTVAGLVKQLSEVTDKSNIKAAWMTHKVDTAAQVQTLADNNIMYAGPASSVPGLAYFNPEAAKDVKVIPLSGVPMATTVDSLRAERDKFLNDHTVGRSFKKRVFPKGKEAKPFIAVIGNAGFVGDDGKRVVVSAKEAYKIGRELGRRGQADIFFTSPGPRADQDYAEIQKTRGPKARRPDSALISGYLKSQREQGFDSRAFKDFWNDPKNMVENAEGKLVRKQINGNDAATILSHTKNCQGLYVNAEGENAKVVTRQFGDLDKTYIIDSKAIHTDLSGQREESNVYFNQKGLTVVSLNEKTGQLEGFENKKPLAPEDEYNGSEEPAVMVLHGMGLVTQSLKHEKKYMRYVDGQSYLIKEIKENMGGGEFVSSATQISKIDPDIDDAFAWEQEYNNTPVMPVTATPLLAVYQQNAGGIVEADYVVWDKGIQKEQDFKAEYGELLGNIGLGKLVETRKNELN